MTAFIFDECFNDKRVIEICNAQNLCRANRYPKKLKGAKDFDMLPIVLSGSSPLVTIEYEILDKHANFIPAKNPGVIIVKYIVVKKLMKTKDAASMLSNFKTKFKNWDKQDWQNIRLEITEEGVIVSRVYDKSSSPIFKISYDAADFEAMLKAALGELAVASKLDKQ